MDRVRIISVCHFSNQSEYDYEAYTRRTGYDSGDVSDFDPGVPIKKSLNMGLYHTKLSYI